MAGGFVLLAGLYVSAFVVSLGRSDEVSPTAIASWYWNKVRIADEVPSPRLVIVGGSNALYGIVAQRIEEKTGVRTVNFGTHAALSLDYLLYRADRVLRPGDTVLLALEYEMYFPAPVNFVMSDYVLGADPGYLLSLGPRELLDWVFSADDAKVAARLFTADESKNEVDEERRRSVRVEQSGRGDVLGTGRAKQSKEQRDAVERLEPLYLVMRGAWSVENAAWKRLGEFVDGCRERGIKVLATFPNTVFFEEYRGGELGAANRGIQLGFAELGIDVLGRARSAMFPKQAFFDTIYHLNREGAEKRTDELIEWLRPYVTEIKAGKGVGRKHEKEEEN